MKYFHYPKVTFYSFVCILSGIVWIEWFNKEGGIKRFHMINFYSVKRKPVKSDPLIAKRVKELIVSQYGEMSVAMQYLF